MKLFLLAVCFVALAAARPKGSGDEEKKGPNPVEGLVRLCIGLAEEAIEEGNKRSWEDVFGQLAPVCQGILEGLKEKEGPRPSGPPPSEAPEKRGRGKMGDEDSDSDDGANRKGGKKGEGKSGDDDEVRPSGPPPSGRPKGPKPSGPPPSGSPEFMDERRMGKGDDDFESKEDDDFESMEDDDDEEVDPVDALLKICEGLAKMAEKEEEAGESKRTFEALLEAMKAVCEAAFEQAEEDM